MPLDPFAVSVKLHMQRHGLTVTELAARAEVPRSTLSAWLHGRRSISLETLRKLLVAMRRLAAVRREIER